MSKPAKQMGVSRLLIVYSLLIAGIAGAGFLVFDAHEKQIKSGKQGEISAIADLKAKQISMWLDERIGDGEIFARNWLIAGYLAQRLGGPPVLSSKTAVRESLAALKDHSRYMNILLADTGGGVLVSANEAGTLCPSEVSRIPETVGTLKPVLIDHHQSESTPETHLSILVPVLNHGIEPPSVIGILVLEINPRDVLHPLVQSWPTPSMTAETLLVRREGDEVVFLNEPRNPRGTEMMKFPVSSGQLPAAMAVLGLPGVVDGVDYRGEQVLTAMQAIPNSTWCLGAKVDADEIYADVRKISYWAALMVGFFILAAGVGLFVIWRSQRLRIFAQLYHAEHDKLALMQRYEFLTRHANDILLLADTDGKIVEANARAVEAYGYGQDELLRMNMKDLYAHEDATLIARDFQKIHEGNGVIYEALHQGKNGTVFPVEISAKYIEIEDTGYYWGTIRDISERKRAEDELRQTNKYLENFFENSPDGIGIVDKQGRAVKWSKVAVEQFGYTLKELQNKSIYDLYADKTDLGKMLAELHRNGKVKEYSINMRKKDGAVAPFDLSISLLRDDANKTIGSVCVARDMSATKRALSEIAVSYHRLNNEIAGRKKAQEASRESEIRYRRLFEAAKDGILILDPETGTIVDANPFVLDLLGDLREEVLGKHLWDIGSFKDAETSRKIFEELRDNRYVRYENLPLQNKAGKAVDVEFVSNVYEVDRKEVIQCNIRDITDRKEAEKIRSKLEAQLTQAHRLEAMGTLAGGIAHDFNNILGIMFGYIEMALLEAPASGSLRENLQQVMTAGNRAKELVKQILVFSRQPQADQERQPLHIGPIVLEALKMLRATLPATIAIRSDIQTTGLVMADSIQVHQVFMNLCTNAAHAMREEGGVLGVSLHDIDLDGTNPRAVLPPGRYVRLSVSDTGPGIPPEVKPRIFDPFFTTKEPGEGTGLGLAVAYGIVKNHRGDLTVYSEPGQGATFNVIFPRTSDMPVYEAQVPVESLSGRERILCVEDEPELLSIVQRMLEKLGYKVEGSTSSIEALKAFEVNPDVYDLVITDQTMPHMTGAKLAKELMRLRPGLPIILCTGFSELTTPNKAREIGVKAMLMKPLTLGELSQTVRSVLDEKRSGK